MDAHELFSAGKLQEAVEAQTATVKSAPGDQAARLFLFELLAFAGLWDRAQRQLDAIHYDDIELSAALESYKQIMAAETARRRLFAEGVQPKFLVDPPEHVRDRLAALNSLRLKQPAEAAKLLDAAADKSAVLTGQLNGKPFDVLADCDDLFGNVLEVFAQGSYYWVPLENVELVAINPPRFPRDLLWAPARLELHEGTAGQVFLPSIYPGSSEHADEQVKLGRMTDWLQEGDGPVLGKGLRMFLVGEETHTLLDWRELNLTPPGPETNG